MRVTVVYNPVAGAGDGARVAERVRAAFAERGHEVDPLTPTPADGTAGVARSAAAAGADRIVAIGGDGTVAEVAEGLLEADRPVALAIVPGGTANVLALNLGIPRGGGAIEVARDGTAVAIDVGLLEGEPFLLSVGTGIHAELVARTDRETKRRWGLAAYGLAGWKTVQDISPTRYVVDCDGDAEEVEATMVQIMNCGAIFRREWEFAPGISPLDGRLDVVAFRARSLADYLTAAAHVVRGDPTSSPLVVHRTGRRVRIESDPPVRVQRDGEVEGRTPAAIAVRPRALPIVMPRTGPWVR